MTSFEELAALAQQTRNPCGKQAFSLATARSAAKTRNQHRHGDTTWYVHPCYFGCGRDIFHLTTRAPDTKKNLRINRGAQRTKMSPGKRARKNRRWEKNRQTYWTVAIDTWEDDGGALHPGSLEDA